MIFTTNLNILELQNHITYIFNWYSISCIWRKYNLYIILSDILLSINESVIWDISWENIFVELIINKDMLIIESEFMLE